MISFNWIGRIYIQFAYDDCQKGHIMGVQSRIATLVQKYMNLEKK